MVASNQTLKGPFTSSSVRVGFTEPEASHGNRTLHLQRRSSGVRQPDSEYLFNLQQRRIPSGNTAGKHDQRIHAVEPWSTNYGRRKAHDTP